MPDISKITLPSGTTYDIKDAVARQMSGGGIAFIGEVTEETAIVDMQDCNPIYLLPKTVEEPNGHPHTPAQNEAVFKGEIEFVYDGSIWHRWGDRTGLGDMALADTASGSFTPSGSVSTPTFTGDSNTFTGTVTPSGSVSLSASSSGGLEVGVASSGTATYTPEGTNAQSSVTGTCTVTPSGSISVGSGISNYTPSGSVSAPTITVSSAGSTTDINNPTAKTVVTDMSVANPNATQASGELIYYSVLNEVLTLMKIVETTGDSINTTSTTVKTGDATYTASTPTFSGSAVDLEFTGSPSSGTISGTADAQTFTGTAVRLETESVSIPDSATFSGSSSSVSVSGTPTGTISTPTFTGTTGTVTVTPDPIS